MVVVPQSHSTLLWEEPALGKLVSEGELNSPHWFSSLTAGDQDYQQPMDHHSFVSCDSTVCSSGEAATEWISNLA